MNSRASITQGSSVSVLQQHTDLTARWTNTVRSSDVSIQTWPPASIDTSRPLPRVPLVDLKGVDGCELQGSVQYLSTHLEQFLPRCYLLTHPCLLDLKGQDEESSSFSLLSHLSMAWCLTTIITSLHMIRPWLYLLHQKRKINFEENHSCPRR